jgi:thiamine transport system ATP-binding protein
MLEVRGLTVRYDGHRALDGVDLRVAEGEVCCLLGPSGSGKSTLLRAVAGLEPATAGRITWDGRDLAGVAVHRRRFGLMFQDHALFPHRDVLGNVAFGLRMQHLARTEVDARARRALTRVGLAGFESRRVRDLSGGEQQRVALARALAPEPRLLMLDEPLGSLDRALRERLVLDLSELLRSLGVTALFVTHDQDEAFALADRVVLLRDGRVEQEGPPQEVWTRPATESAARFLGFANLLPDQRDGRPVWLALRPDGLRVEAPPGPPGALAATVTGSTFRGDHFLVRVDAAVGPLEIAAPVPHAPGTPVAVTVDPTAIVVVPRSG